MNDLIIMENPDILLIQGTKCEEDSFLRRRKIIWAKGNGIASSSRGSPRGIGTLWKEAAFKLVHHRT